MESSAAYQEMGTARTRWSKAFGFGFTAFACLALVAIGMLELVLLVDIPQAKQTTIAAKADFELLAAKSPDAAATPNYATALEDEANNTAVDPFEEGNLTSGAAIVCYPHFHPWESLGTPPLSHYCKLPNDNKTYYMPVPGCSLPPPQPYWLQTTLTTLKATLTWLLLRTKVKKNSEYTFCGRDTFEYEKLKMSLTFKANWALLALSILLMMAKVWGFSTSSYWEHYQCYGVAMCFAPWGGNFVLAFAQMFGFDRGGDTLRRKTYGVQGYDRFNALVEMKEGGFELSLNLIGFALFVAINVFFFTHLLPGFLLVGGVVPLVLVPMPGMAIVLLLFGDMYNVHSKDEGTAEQKINNASLVALPVVFGFTCFFAYTSTAYTFVWDGMPRWAAMWTAMSERQSSIYFEEVHRQIFGAYTYLSELMNEALP